jgi:hypothetical protein
VFDGANLVATIDQNANLQDAYLFAGVDHPLRLSRGGSSYFYEVDLAGNVRRLRDATGADLGGYRYTAFGAGFGVDAQTPAPAVGQAVRWKGRWFEETSPEGAGEVVESGDGGAHKHRRVPLPRAEDSTMGVARAEPRRLDRSNRTLGVHGRRER